jgi:translocation and assembly module TamA
VESEVRVDLASYTATIAVHYETGPRYLFGPTIFRQDALNPSLLRGFVTWHEGEPLNSNELLSLQNALAETPYFSRVEVAPDREDAVGVEVPILVNLLPSKPWRFRFGIGYGTDTGPRGTLDAQFRRINRSGHRAELNVIGSSLEQSATGKYIIPGAYPRTDALTFTAGYARLQPTTYNTQSAFAGADYSLAVGKRWRESFFLSFARDVFTVGLDAGTSRLLTPGVNSTLVVADDRIDTRNGYRVQVRVTGASSAVGSTASFGQILASGKRIFSLTHSDRFIARADIGWMTTPDFHALPPRVRFFAGGDVSVRGYKYQSIGETDAAGNVIGGKTLETASLEFEHRFLPKWGGAVFFDAGNALNSFTSTLKKGAGVGVRWISPIGPVRLDGAYALDSPRGFRVHVNIGPDL